MNYQKASYLTDEQADALIHALVVNLYSSTDRPSPPWDIPLSVSKIAAIVCDAVSADISLQPLHDAYGRHPDIQAARQASQPQSEVTK